MSTYYPTPNLDANQFFVDEVDIEKTTPKTTPPSFRIEQGGELFVGTDNANRILTINNAGVSANGNSYVEETISYECDLATGICSGSLATKDMEPRAYGGQSPYIRLSGIALYSMPRLVEVANDWTSMTDGGILNAVNDANNYLRNVYPTTRQGCFTCEACELESDPVACFTAHGCGYVAGEAFDLTLCLTDTSNLAGGHFDAMLEDPAANPGYSRERGVHGLTKNGEWAAGIGIGGVLGGHFGIGGAILFGGGTPMNRSYNTFEYNYKE